MSSVNLQTLQDQVSRIQTQTISTFSFMESGLAHLSRQLEHISKHNDSQKQIISHLKEVVQSNFEQINKQEDQLKHTNAKLAQLFSILKSFASVVDEKVESLDNLNQTVQTLLIQTKPVISPVHQQATESTSEIPSWIFPGTPMLFHEIPPNYYTDIFNETA